MGTWVVQLVEHPTLDSGSGHDPRVMGSSPMLGSTLSVQPAWDSLPLSLCLFPLSLLSLSLSLSLSLIKKKRGGHLGGSVKHLPSAQVMILQFVSLGPASDSVLTAQNLEPALDSVSPSLSAPSPLVLSLSLFQNKH